jgi:hypothetical protein
MIGSIKRRTYSNFYNKAGQVTIATAPGYNNILETLSDSTASRLETTM